jgi:hypothetical protein
VIESDFTQALKAGLEAQRCWAHKPPDLARAIRKPCDLLVCANGRFWGIENKLTKHEGALRPGLKAVSEADFRGRRHQLETLRQIMDRARGFPFVGACVMSKTMVSGQYPKRAWLLPFEEYERQELWKIGELERLPDYELIWQPKVGWTVSAAFIRRFAETPLASW